MIEGRNAFDQFRYETFKYLLCPEVCFPVGFKPSAFVVITKLREKVRHLAHCTYHANSG